jgi:AcrR family transcriptional regulator
MTQAPELTEIPAAPASLRERKKLATRRALRRAALSLIVQRGYAHVTVEDIAEAAEVSPRTFFNYFASKEAVLFGGDAGRLSALRARLLEHPPGENALTALQEALAGEARAISDELAALGPDRAGWLRQAKSAYADPHLQAARAAHMASMEAVIATALAERLGADADRDPYPLLLASTGLAVLRTALSSWSRSGGAVPLDQLTTAACQALASGLPEDHALRDAVTAPAGHTPPDTASAQHNRKDNE